MTSREELAKLREPFDPGQIGKKPLVNCRACTEATKAARSGADKHCDRHTMVKCPTCKAYITTGHTHLDYVGHAVTTSRLLSVDPDWSWEPMGYTSEGLPATDEGGNLWIWLTVAGTRRPGVGDGASAKEAIGDAIRNAAMRFGVALDLWAKEDLDHNPEQAKEELPPVDVAPAPDPLALAKARAWAAINALHPAWEHGALIAELTDTLKDVYTVESLDEATVDQWEAIAEEWEIEAKL